jgi:hypothetical protein
MTFLSRVKRIKNLEIILFLFFISFFYYFIPIILILLKKNKDFFSSQVKENYVSELIFFSDGFTILIALNFFLFLFLYFFITKNISSQKIKNNNEIKGANFLYKYFLYLICLIVIFDIIKIFKNLFEFIQLNEHFIETNTFNEIFKLYRENIKEIIFQKRTHYKIFIILSVYFFKFDKKTSLFCYFLIFFANILTFSRFEILQLFTLHILFNVRIVNINKNFLICIILFLLFLINYRFFLFLYKTEDFYLLLTNLFGDGNSVFLTNFIVYENLKAIGNFFENHPLDITYIYLKDNLFYLLRDFFKVNLETINYFQHYSFSNFAFAISPFTECIIYLPVFSFYTFILYFMNICSFIKNKLLFNLVFLTILIYSFRGSLLHEMGFLIKFLVLIKITEFISSNIFIKKYVKFFYKKNPI